MANQLPRFNGAQVSAPQKAAQQDPYKIRRKRKEEEKVKIAKKNEGAG